VIRTARPPRTARPSRTRTIALTVGAPILLLGAAGAVVVSWSSRLPDPVASHWGPHGVNGTSSLAGLLGGFLAIGVLMILIFGGIGFVGTQPAFTRKMSAALSVGVSTFLGGLPVLIAWCQLDVADAHQARGLSLGAVVGVVLLGVVLGAAAARLTAPDDVAGAGEPVPADAARTALGSDERVVWTATVRMRGVYEVVVGATVLALVDAALAGQAAILGFLAVLVVLLMVLGRWRVTVDRTGLRARAVLGWPRAAVALDDVVRADVVRVRPLREFGGWGFPRADRKGRYGLVLRAGDAIGVERVGGGVLVVTVDGASDAVALLNALAGRARAK
jgi:hypothetical protein